MPCHRQNELITEAHAWPSDPPPSGPIALEVIEILREIVNRLLGRHRQKEGFMGAQRLLAELVLDLDNPFRFRPCRCRRCRFRDGRRPVEGQMLPDVSDTERLSVVKFSGWIAEPSRVPHERLLQVGVELIGQFDHHIDVRSGPDNRITG